MHTIRRNLHSLGVASWRFCCRFTKLQAINDFRSRNVVVIPYSNHRWGEIKAIDNLKTLRFLNKCCKWNLYSHILWVGMASWDRSSLIIRYNASEYFWSVWKSKTRCIGDYISIDRFCLVEHNKWILIHKYFFCRIQSNNICKSIERKTLEFIVSNLPIFLNHVRNIKLLSLVSLKNSN